MDNNDQKNPVISVLRSFSRLQADGKLKNWKYGGIKILKGYLSEHARLLGRSEVAQ